MHAAFGITLWHFLMHDAAAGRHPLHIAGTERATVAETVTVLDGSRQNIRYGFDAAVRMPRKSGQIVGRPVIAKIVEQQKGVGL